MGLGLAPMDARGHRVRLPGRDAAHPAAHLRVAPRAARRVHLRRVEVAGALLGEGHRALREARP